MKAKAAGELRNNLTLEKRAQEIEEKQAKDPKSRGGIKKSDNVSRGVLVTSVFQ